MKLYYVAGVSIPHRFNSHRDTVDRGGFCQILFQSLTGSIHTFEVSGRDEKEEAVSIPHRFNSHPGEWHVFCANCIRFNPSQVQFTHGLRLG